MGDQAAPTVLTATAPFVFVSYASADRERVEAIVGALERAGVGVWLDRAGIPGGASYAVAITAAIKGAAALVLLASPASLASRNVRQELALAWRYETPYLVLRLDPVEIPDDLAYWLEASQWVEVLGQTEGAWLPATLAALRGLGLDAAPTITPVAPTAPVPPPPPEVLPRSETRYARSGDVSIAYQVVGDGPVDLVYVPGFISHIEHMWDLPSHTALLRRLAAFSRLIPFDKRGTGLSDRIAGASLMEERMDDIRAVMDAVGSERAVVYGASEGGLLATLFAATYPERVTALILYGASAASVRQPDYPDYPWKASAEEKRRQLDDLDKTIHQTWGTLEDAIALLEKYAPTVANDTDVQRWMAAEMRLGASPGSALARWRMNLDLDVRHVLPSIRVPTLVLHRTGDRDTNVEEGRYIAAHIPGARFVELPGDDHFPFVGDTDAIVDAIEAFVGEVGEAAEPDTVLATVLAVTLDAPDGAVHQADAPWRFQALAQRELVRHRGQRYATADDALLVTFDGPARAVRCAQALVRGAAGLGLALRAGLHTGECLLGDDRASGPAVDLAIRVAAQASPGEVLASGTVRDLVAGAGLAFAERGERSFPGLHGSWRLFAVG